jgi:hypothetical protein
MDTKKMIPYSLKVSPEQKRQLDSDAVRLGTKAAELARVALSVGLASIRAAADQPPPKECDA